MNIRFEKIASTIERDIRNQVVIDKLKRLNRKQKLMVYARTHIRQLALLLNFVIWAFFVFGIVHAFAVECPNPGEACKVLLLTPQEERMLMGQNGILDTAAQARSLDLGQFAVYLKTRIGSAAQGEVKPVPAPAPVTGTQTGNNPPVLDNK
jgi:hypothetical protein